MNFERIEVENLYEEANKGLINRGFTFHGQAPNGVYYDTLTYHFETLDYLFKYFGAERILYGTDLPFADVEPAAEAFVQRLDCTDAERELIYHGNAETLLGI